MTRYDLWKESGPVDALTRAEAEDDEEGRPTADELRDEDADRRYQSQKDDGR